MRLEWRIVMTYRNEDTPPGTKPTPPSTPNAFLGSTPTNANLVYILFLVAFVIGITAPIAVVMAYLNRGRGPAWIDSHYTFQIHTFWKGLLFAFIGYLTLIVGIGFVILLFGALWIVVRCVKGMIYLSEGKPHPDPQTWMFG